MVVVVGFRVEETAEVVVALLAVVMVVVTNSSSGVVAVSVVVVVVVSGALGVELSGFPPQAVREVSIINTERTITAKRITTVCFSFGKYTVFSFI